MADLFGYTAPQQIVDPSSPTVQVEPNMQAANAFKSLSGLMDTMAQAKSQQLQIKQAEQNRYNEILAENQRVAASNIKERKAIAKAEQKQYEDALYVNTNTAYTAMYSDYKNAYEEAGDNAATKAQATAQFQSEIQSMYDQLPSEVQTRVTALFQGGLRTSNSDLAKDARKSAVESFYTDMHLTMPAAMAMDAQGLEAEYKRLQETAKGLNIPLNELGDKFVTASKGLLMADIAADENNIINNNDIAAIDKALARVDELAKIDGSKSSVIESAREELQGLKRQVFDNVKTGITGFIQVSDRQNFDNYLNKGLEIGAINEDEAVIYKSKYLDTYASSGKQAERTVTELSRQTNGRYLTRNLSGKTETFAKQEIKDRIRSQILNGKIDADYFQWQANNNTEVFKSAFNEFHSGAVGNVRQLALEQANAKDPEVKQQKALEVFEAVRELNNLQAHGHGTISSKELFDATVIKTLVTSNQIANIPDALQNLNNLGEVTPISKVEKNVKNIYSELPDRAPEAHRVYSALVQAGVDKTQALDSVLTRYSFKEIDGIKGQVSGGVMESMQTAGFGPKAIEKFEEVLLDPNIEGLNSEDRNAIQGVISGTNPRWYKEGNNIKVRNDEGSVAALPLSETAMKDVAQIANKRYTDENQATGFEKITADLGNAISDVIYTNAKDAINVLAVPARVTQDAGVSALMAADTITDMAMSLGSELNQFVENTVYGGMTGYEANRIMMKNIGATWKKSTKRNKAVTAEMDKAFKQALQEAGDSIATQFNYAEGQVTATAQALVDVIAPAFQMALDFVIPKSEGSELTDSNMDYYKQSEGDELHLDQRNILTMPYGVVPNSGVTKAGASVDARNNTLTKADLTSIDTSKATHKVGGVTIKREDYTTDKEFAQGVFDAYETKASSYYSKYDSLSDGQKKFIVDVAWNAGTGAADWNSTKTAVAELSKDKPDYTKVYPVMANFKTGGVWARGLMKRRAQSLNFMLPENKRIKSIHTQKNADGTVKFYAKDKSGTVVFSRTKSTGISGVAEGFLNVPDN